MAIGDVPNLVISIDACKGLETVVGLSSHKLKIESA